MVHFGAFPSHFDCIGTRSALRWVKRSDLDEIGQLICASEQGGHDLLYGGDSPHTSTFDVSSWTFGLWNLPSHGPPHSIFALTERRDAHKYTIRSVAKLKARRKHSGKLVQCTRVGGSKRLLGLVSLAFEWALAGLAGHRLRLWQALSSYKSSVPNNQSSARLPLASFRTNS